MKDSHPSRCTINQVDKAASASLTIPDPMIDLETIIRLEGAVLHNNNSKTKDLLRLVDMLKVEWVAVWANQVSNNNSQELVNQDSNKNNQALDQDHSLL